MKMKPSALTHHPQPPLSTYKIRAIVMCRASYLSVPWTGTAWQEQLRSISDDLARAREITREARAVCPQQWKRFIRSTSMRYAIQDAVVRRCPDTTTTKNNHYTSSSMIMQGRQLEITNDWLACIEVLAALKLITWSSSSAAATSRVIGVFTHRPQHYQGGGEGGGSASDIEGAVIHWASDVVEPPRLVECANSGSFTPHIDSGTVKFLRHLQQTRRHVHCYDLFLGLYKREEEGEAQDAENSKVLHTFLVGCAVLQLRGNMVLRVPGSVFVSAWGASLLAIMTAHFQAIRVFQPVVWRRTSEDDDTSSSFGDVCFVGTCLREYCRASLVEFLVGQLPPDHIELPLDSDAKDDTQQQVSVSGGGSFLPPLLSEGCLGAAFAADVVRCWRKLAAAHCVRAKQVAADFGFSQAESGDGGGRQQVSKMCEASVLNGVFDWMHKTTLRHADSNTVESRSASIEQQDESSGGGNWIYRRHINPNEREQAAQARRQVESCRRDKEHKERRERELLMPPTSEEVAERSNRRYRGWRDGWRHRWLAKQKH